MEVILLWKKTKVFFGLSIFPNIITEKWGYSKNHSDQEINSLNILGNTVEDLSIFIKQTDPIVVVEMQIGASGDG